MLVWGGSFSSLAPKAASYFHRQVGLLLKRINHPSPFFPLPPAGGSVAKFQLGGMSQGHAANKGRRVPQFSQVGTILLAVVTSACSQLPCSCRTASEWCGNRVSIKTGGLKTTAPKRPDGRGGERVCTCRESVPLDREREWEGGRGSVRVCALACVHVWTERG